MWWKKTSFLIFLTVFLACAWFFSTGGWNQISRIDAIMSFVEFPVEKRANPDFLTFRINHFVPSPEKGYNTGDWSFYKGNYYSNKAPGPLFLGILAYAPLHCLEYLIFGFLDDILTDVINMYIVNLVQSVLPAALAAWILFHILQILGTGKYASAFWSLAYGLGTPVFCYSSMMWGHVPAACCFMFAIYFYLKNKNKSTVWCGLFCGFAVLSDYLCAALVPAFAAMLFLREYLKTEGRGKEKIMEGIKSLVPFALGGLPMFLLYALYHKICFGSFFTPATVFNNPMFHDKDTLGGTFGSFRPFIILKLLISQHRGLLFYSPVLLAFVPGFLNMIRKEREKRILGWGLLAVIFMTLFSLSSFNGWHGGHSFSARYLIPVIPAFAVLCGAFPLNTLLRKSFAAGAFLLSFFYMLTANYLNPLVNDFIQEPFWGYLMDLFRNTGRMPPPPHLMRMYGMIENMKEEAAAYSSFSLGELLGLSGYGSMILLTILLCVLIGLIYRDEVKNTSVFREKLRKINSYNFQFSFSSVLFCVLLVLLFSLPGMTPWINDEPSLLFAAIKNNDMLTFAVRGLTGSVGFFYGPPAVWFYQGLLLLTFEPSTLVLLKVLVTVLASVWAIRNICKTLELDWIKSFVFLFASPFAWHYTRVLWDNVLLFPLSLCLLAFVCRFLGEEKSTCKNAVGAGICGCGMLLVHPMSLPVVALFPFVLLADVFLRKKEESKKITPYGSIFLGGMIAALPALYFYLPQVLAGHGKKGTVLSGNVENIKSISIDKILAYMENLSGFGYGKWFISELTGGNSGIVYSVAGIFLLCLFTLCLLAGSIVIVKKVLKKDFSAETLFGGFCICILLAKIIMEYALKLKVYPHYQMPYIPVAGFLVLTGAKYIWKNGRGFMVVTAGNCVLLLMTFSLFLTIYFHDGTKSFVYGPTLGNQYENVQIVNRMKSLGVLNNFRHSVGNYRAFPQALECLFLLHDHSYKPEEKFLPPSGVKYDVILRYISPAPVSGLLGVDVRQVSGPEYDFFANRKE